MTGMADALIGASGFVGTSLSKQHSFGAHFRSSDIQSIEGRAFNTVVCTGAPAQKWIANREPQADEANIQKLIRHLDSVQCDNFVLISTVDVFANPSGVNEASSLNDDGLHAYGRNRRALEAFVAKRFARHLIVRLPGLVGPGLRKNVIFDLLNDNNLAAVDSRAVFQFYPMVNLWPDILTAQAAGLALVHLTAAPISVAELAARGFGRSFVNTVGGTPPAYDFQTGHAALFGGSGLYQYSARESLLAVRAYAQSEPRAAVAARVSP